MQRPNLTKALTLLSCTAVLTACDPLNTLSNGDSSNDLNASEGAGFGLTQPAVLQSRSVNQQLLLPKVTVGGARVTMSPNGDSAGRWSGRFSLPADTGTEPTEYALIIEWLYDIRGTAGSEGDDIVLARAPQQTISNASSRQITPGQYSTDFDEDNDGTTNLAELNADRDPLVDDRQAIPVAPNAQQSDCRDIPAGLLSRLAPVIRLSGPSTSTEAVARAAGLTVFAQAFFVEARGTLTAEKVAGLPEQGGILLFDRAVNATTQRNIAADSVAPLGVSAVLNPGLYCIGVVVADLDNQVFSDVTMRYTFAP